MMHRVGRVISAAKTCRTATSAIAGAANASLTATNSHRTAVAALALQSSFAAVVHARWSSSTPPTKPVVQVLRHDAPSKQSYAQVEQDIAAMQREIRDAYNAGNYNEALEVGLTCRDVVERHFGTTHPVFASTITNIALMYKSLGQLPEAVESYEYALQVYKASVGDRHASFATTLHNLGAVYRTQALTATGMARVTALHRAMECFEESLAIRKHILEPGHPDIALSMCSLGVIYWHHKEPEKAFSTLQEALEVLTNRVGRASPLTALAMNNLAYVHKEARQYDEAVALYEQVVAVRTRVLGATHNETILAQHNLAEAYRASGQEDRAVGIQQQILELFDADAMQEENDKRQ